MSWLIPSIPGWSRAPAVSPDKTEDKRVDGEEEEENLDIPPPFPLLNSHQRSAAPGPSKATSPAPTPFFNLAPPSPPRNTDDDEPASDLNIAVTDGTVPIGDMAPPPSTTKKPDFGIQKGGDTSTAGPRGGLGATSKPKGKKGKVALAPGCSALDWARLCSSGKDLKGTGFGILRVTMDELKKHNTRQDAWSAFNGKVYNMTAYLPFHPGGEDELMRVAGRDGTKLFMLTHSWVNMDYMLQECMVGVMVRG